MGKTPCSRLFINHLRLNSTNNYEWLHHWTKPDEVDESIERSKTKRPPQDEAPRRPLLTRKRLNND